MPIEVSRFTALLMDKAQIAALIFMAGVYLLKIRWIMSYKASRERTPSRGDETKAVLYSYMTLVRPWELPSARRHWWRWVEFALFHVAVAVAIGVTFVMPYWPQALASRPAIWTLQAVFGVGLIMALSRLARRIVRPEMRLITSPDDVFSLILLSGWLASGILAAPQRSEAALIAFFGLTAFFLVYVPFSKISHYIYWPFIRYYLGKHLGHRGTYPTKAVPFHS